ncbi:MAG: ATP-binding cassette domain-containing protein, partial [Clostridia bacterium]|nr:ATP-binding cassette domain-containing protein [Clostridia bacterium]
MILQGKNLSRQFFRDANESNVFTAVNGADIKLCGGEMAVLMGRSGSGKSTLLNMLAGLLAPTEGQVLLDEMDLYAISDKERSFLRNKHIGVVPQGQTGLKSLTVLENVLLPCMLYEKTDKSDYAISLLEKAGIANLAKCFPGELSGGE